MIIPRNYPFGFPMIIPITVCVTRRWGWEKREQQMFPNLPAKLSGGCFTSGRETIHV